MAFPTLQQSTSIGRTVRRVKNVSGFCNRRETVREQLRLETTGATSEEITVLADVGWLFVVDWRKQGGAYGCAMRMAAAALGVVE